ncbi:transcriptional regulator [Chryseobacterium lactis]|uniref:Transcriptional regulator n=1 Tax=Chryseobacterium lactis TaxID=1241981 RepID=A0A3G6RQ92_CHRLC|nr:GntR family transcriptional regulator [Chryseobacterium lactis]AZA81002.1 GntR family transcriptional regulator [Chryseobacterium lactis]AZB06003.1 GntR family transcriptional regulator [Chryseobacterium lactis]PNW10935.1 transcriptional regulator [Chryseobacterium lactis]
MKLVIIDKESNTPIYKQIIECIEQAIISKRLFRNDRLPSVNKICMENQVSRDTVLLAYDVLKKKGIIQAIPAKGYYVRTEDFTYEKRYFLLFDELNSFKEDLLNSFLKGIGKKGHVDIFFHHFNYSMFRKLIKDNTGNYNKYIIMPGNVEAIEPFLESLAKDDVYIIDQMRDTLKQYPGIYQNFVKDIFEAMTSYSQVLQKYNHFIIVFPGEKEPIDMVNGFVKYCETFHKNYSIISGFQRHSFRKGQMFLIPDDRQLVQAVEKCKEKKLKLGTDIGIISYNETPLKKVVEEGITTLSTDFSSMGKRLAEMVIKNEKVQIENPSKLYLRKSL